EKLMPKCGHIIVHHWAHPGEDCDPWREHETDWHRYWKSLVPSNCTEVTIERNGAIHRADIVTKKGIVIELQHSSISVDSIQDREAFYGHMMWLFDLRECRPEPKYEEMNDRKYLINAKEIRLRLRPKDNHHTFRWCHARKSIAYAKAKVYFDVGGNEIFGLRKMYIEKRCGGWGLLKSKEIFESWLKKQCISGD
ncbi:MAG: competence protein CoiA, partial [Verrucomicrobiota bacterium]